MRHIPRFFINKTLCINTILDLAPEQVNHVVSVLRMQEGQELYLFNGQDGEFTAIIDRLHKKSCTLKIVNQRRPSLQDSQEIHLYFSMLKQHRTEILLEKVTELGVTDLHACQYDFTSARPMNLDKADQQVLQAAQQCGRLSVPQIHPYAKLADSYKSLSTMCVFVCDIAPNVCCVGDAELQCNLPIAIIIGPEGGLSPKERQQLSALPFVNFISLSQNILRAETAAITALALIQHQLDKVQASRKS